MESGMKPILTLPPPACFRALSCDLNALLGWQRSRPRYAALATQRDGSWVFCFGWFGFGGFPDGFQEDLPGKLDRISRALGCHAHSMQLSAKEGQAQDFQTDPLPKCETKPIFDFIFLESIR